MKIQFNTDKNVEGNQRLETYFSGEIKKAFSHVEDKITRFEVHFGDENGDKVGVHDKRCVIEARPIKLNSIAITTHADTIEKAFHLALDKIKKALTTAFEKQKEH